MVRSLLNTFPSWAIMLLTTGGSLALGMAAEWWLRRRTKNDDTENNEMLALTFEFVGIAYAILVGFVIVSLWETQQDARTSVATEAATLEDFVALDHALAPHDRAAIEAAITDYVHTVTVDEFPRLEHGHH